MKTFWITGARGFIGRHLARNLALSGNRICGLGHGAWPEIESNLWGISYWLNAEVSISSLAQLKAKLGKPGIIPALITPKINQATKIEANPPVKVGFSWRLK